MSTIGGCYYDGVLPSLLTASSQLRPTQPTSDVGFSYEIVCEMIQTQMCFSSVSLEMGFQQRHHV